MKWLFSFDSFDFRGLYGNSLFYISTFVMRKPAGKVFKQDVRKIMTWQNEQPQCDPTLMLVFMGDSDHCSWMTNIHVRHQQNSSSVHHFKPTGFVCTTHLHKLLFPFVWIHTRRRDKYIVLSVSCFHPALCFSRFLLLCAWLRDCFNIFGWKCKTSVGSWIFFYTKQHLAGLENGTLWKQAPEC